MKIFAVGMNYATHNKELHHSLDLSEPVIFMKADSVLKDGKPFFIPDFSDEVHYETEIVIKICRLGKNIDERFAPRYYDEVTVGIDFTARDRQRELRDKGLPWELSKAFDHSAAVGEFVPLNTLGDIQQLAFRLVQHAFFDPPDRSVCKSLFYPAHGRSDLYGHPRRGRAGTDRRPSGRLPREPEGTRLLCTLKTRKKKV